MALGKPSKIGCSHVNDASLINLSRGDESSFDEFSQPGGSLWVVLIVVGAHGM
jgi:hypothetical protein